MGGLNFVLLVFGRFYEFRELAFQRRSSQLTEDPRLMPQRRHTRRRETKGMSLEDIPSTRVHPYNSQLQELLLLLWRFLSLNAH